MANYYYRRKLRLYAMDFIKILFACVVWVGTRMPQ